MKNYKLALYVICIMVVALFITTVGSAFAQGPVYNPPTQGTGWQYHRARTSYDLNYTYRYGVYGYNQVNGYWQGYKQYGVFGTVADPNW